MSVLPLLLYYNSSVISYSTTYLDIIYSKPLFTPSDLRVCARQVVIRPRNQETEVQRDVVQSKNDKTHKGQDEDMQHNTFRSRQHKERKMMVVHVPHLSGGRALVLDNEIVLNFLGDDSGHE